MNRDDRIHARIVDVNGIRIGGRYPLVLIAGPCQIENMEHTRMIAAHLTDLCARLGIALIFKASFDKANRTSLHSRRGVGVGRGMEILARVRDDFAIPVLTDVHEPEQCARAAEACDVLQIPAFLCRQTDLLLAAGETGRAVNIKKGQFAAPGDMAKAAEKVHSTGNRRILLCERGTFFGYGSLVNDMRGLPTMAETGWPVVFDATHSAQSPGSMGDRSGGDRRFVPVLARAAVAVGVSALFVETHDDPEHAPSDGPVMVPLHRMKDFLPPLMEIDRMVKQGRACLL